MGSIFFQKYKRRFLIALGVLIALTSLALGKYNIILGVMAFVTTILGLFAFNYVDQQERIIREREFQAELIAKREKEDE